MQLIIELAEYSRGPAKYLTRVYLTDIEPEGRRGQSFPVTHVHAPARDVREALAQALRDMLSNVVVDGPSTGAQC